MAPKRSARSPTGDSFDLGSDDESIDTNAGAGGSNAGKKGKEKESKHDRDQRKAQNRIAQREFRQRKVQYVRDLEARIALYESSKDDQMDQMKAGMRALLDENQQLRTLLAGVAGFIGEGVGGILPQLAIDLPEFENLIHRGRTDNVIETISSVREASKRGESPRNPKSGPASKRPRTSEDDLADSTLLALANNNSSTTTVPNGMSSTSSSNNSYLFAPSSLPGTSLLNPSATNLSNNNLYANYSNFSPVTDNLNQFESPKDGSTEGSNGVANNNDPEMDRIRKNFKPPVTHEDQNTNEDSILELFSTPTDNPKLQAIQLISYHMRNKRENPSYHLPPSLKATVTQQSVPHSPFFDGIVFASLRDRLILLKDQYDLPSLVNDLIDSFLIHEDDILLPTNWEISEDFLRKYWYVIDSEVLSITNHWRKLRGDPELTMRQLVPDGQDISAEGALGTRRRD